MTHQYEKPIRKKLWELAGLAHEHELSSALETLDRHFAQDPLGMPFSFTVCK